MNNSSRLLLDIWSVIEDHVSKSNRQQVAMALLRALGDYGIELEEFAEAGDDDNYLEAALSAMSEDDESLDGELNDWSGD